MRDCIFVQWKKPTDPSRFVIDGILSNYANTDSQNDVINLLMDVPMYKELCRNRGNDELSPSFRRSYRKNKKSFLQFVEGNFKETDTAGRKLVYIFCTSEKSGEEVADKLIEYANILGLTLHEGDLDAIRRQDFKKKNLNRILLVTLCLIIVTIIFLLLFL